MLSAEGFCFLILPVQLMPFTIYPDSHVQINIKAFSVFAESIGDAVMRLYLTLVDVFKIVK